MNLESYLLNKDEDLVSLFKSLDAIVMETIDNKVEKIMQYGMPAYVVPLKLFPKGYLDDPNQPLPYISIAIQKNYVSLYNMCFLVKKDEIDRIMNEYETRTKKKISRGKSCIRFRKGVSVEIDLIRSMVQIMDVNTWVDIYKDTRKVN